MLQNKWEQDDENKIEIYQWNPMINTVITKPDACLNLKFGAF